MAAVLANDPAIGLGIVLAPTPLLALILHRQQQRIDLSRDILRSHDAARTAPWHDGALLRSQFSITPTVWPIGEEHRMQRSKGAGIIATYPPDLWPIEGHPKPALYARMWAAVLAALHQSRKDEAARVIRRHRELIDNFQAIEISGASDGVNADA